MIPYPQKTNLRVTLEYVFEHLRLVYAILVHKTRRRVSWRRVRKAVANSGEWNDLVKKAQANYSHTGWTCHCTHWVCQYCVYFYSLAIYSGRTCYVKKMRVASARRNGRVGFRTSGTRARTKFLKITVHKMYRKCTQMYEKKMYKRMYRNCTVLDTNVQLMYRNSVMDLFKNGPNHVTGLGGP